MSKSDLDLNERRATASVGSGMLIGNWAAVAEGGRERMREKNRSSSSICIVVVKESGEVRGTRNEFLLC